MPKITLTFRFLDDSNNLVNWAPGDLSAIQAQALLENVNSTQPNIITAQTKASIASPQTCGPWKGVFDALSAPFLIFKGQGTEPVDKFSNCIGKCVAGSAGTLYVRKKPAPVSVSAAVSSATTAVTVNALAAADAVATFLSAQTKIRVYIPGSLGTGHQTTTCNIIRRIISKGFTGTTKTFEVVYAPEQGNVSAIKILLPELNISYTNSGSVYTISAGSGTGGTYSNAGLGNCPFLFIAAGTTIADQVDFGISGGVDTTTVDPRGATITNTKYFLMLQPFQWNAANYFFGVTQVDLGDVSLLDKLEFLGTTCYYVDYTIYSLWTSVSAYVAQITDPSGQSVTYGQAVTDIQTQCYASAGVNVLPVYGLTRGGTSSVLSNWPSVTQISALANIVLAVLRGQATSPMNKGTVIMTLDGYQVTETDSSTKAWTGTWIDNLKALLPKIYQDRLTFWPQNSADAWNVSKITGLGTDRILIVNLPKLLPMPIFNYFYLNSSMPPIFEGKGTMPIMLNSGKPYLQLSKQNDGLDTVASLNSSAAIKTMKVFLFPSVPFAFDHDDTTETTIQNTFSKQCLIAGNAAVRNIAASQTTVTKTTFGLTDDTQFDAIKTYLLTNNYVNSSCQVLNKFKALPDATAMEAQTTPLILTNGQIFTFIQTALGQSFTDYNTAIAALATFFATAMTGSSTLAGYFTDLRDYFNNEANDKLMKGLGYAVAAIPTS